MLSSIGNKLSFPQDFGKKSNNIQLFGQKVNSQYRRHSLHPNHRVNESIEKSINQYDTGSSH